MSTRTRTIITIDGKTTHRLWSSFKPAHRAVIAAKADGATTAVVLEVERNC